MTERSIETASTTETAITTEIPDGATNAAPNRPDVFVDIDLTTGDPLDLEGEMGPMQAVTGENGRLVLLPVFSSIRSKLKALTEAMSPKELAAPSSDPNRIRNAVALSGLCDEERERVLREVESILARVSSTSGSKRRS